MNTYFVHYPIAMSLNAESFNTAAKDFVKQNRNFNINQMIMSDQFNRYKKALIRNYVVNGTPKAQIKFHSYQPMVPPTTQFNPVTTVQSNNLPFPLMVPGLTMNTVGFGPSNVPLRVDLDD